MSDNYILQLFFLAFFFQYLKFRCTYTKHNQNTKLHNEKYFQDT